MLNSRSPSDPSRTFSRSYVTPTLRAHLDDGGSVAEWLAGRVPVASMARISADRLIGDGIGIERQHRANIRNAGLHECAVVMHYEDNNFSAAKQDVIRPAFAQMIKDITHGHEEETGIPLSGCIAVERERVYRLPQDFVALKDALIMVGDGVFIEDKTLLNLVGDDGPAGSGGPGHAGAAQAEIRTMSKRAVRSAADRAEEGAVYGGPRRFGWLGASKEPFRLGNKHKNLDEWPHLIEMIKQRNAGRSWRAITAHLNRQGVGTARGNRFTEQAVKGMVTNPA